MTYVIEAWHASLLDGRESALRAATHAVAVARSVRSHRAYAWRAVSAGRLREAGQLRRAVVQVDAYAQTREDPAAWAARAWVLVALDTERP